MSKAFEALIDSYQRHVSDDSKRATAVTVALEIIQAKVANTPADNSIVEKEMGNLKAYTDQILAALKA